MAIGLTIRDTGSTSGSFSGGFILGIGFGFRLTITGSFGWHNMFGLSLGFAIKGLYNRFR